MPDELGTPGVRPYRASDRDALFEVCVRTGDAGGDATGLYDDEDLLPTVFLAPYLDFEPGLAFVYDPGDGAAGYIVGTSDTAAFVAWSRAEYLPRVAGRFPAPPRPATPSDEMRALLHRPERMLYPELTGHPAHLHIDLLPPHQRGGHGRELMTAFLGALHDRGVPAVHLSMLTGNRPARAFYDRLGFHELAVAEPAPLTFLGRPTA